MRSAQRRPCHLHVPGRGRTFHARCRYCRRWRRTRTRRQAPRPRSDPRRWQQPPPRAPRWRAPPGSCSAPACTSSADSRLQCRSVADACRLWPAQQRPDPTAAPSPASCRRPPSPPRLLAAVCVLVGRVILGGRRTESVIRSLVQRLVRGAEGRRADDRQAVAVVAAGAAALRRRQLVRRVAQVLAYLPRVLLRGPRLRRGAAARRRLAVLKGRARAAASRRRQQQRACRLGGSGGGGPGLVGGSAGGGGGGRRRAAGAAVVAGRRGRDARGGRGGRSGRGGGGRRGCGRGGRRRRSRSRTWRRGRAGRERARGGVQQLLPLARALRLARDAAGVLVVHLSRGRLRLEQGDRLRGGGDDLLRAKVGLAGGAQVHGEVGGRAVHQHLHHALPARHGPHELPEAHVERRRLEAAVLLGERDQPPTGMRTWSPALSPLRQRVGSQGERTLPALRPQYRPPHRRTHRG
eukprot:scaffold5178_cov364-Prasinococcus_capsulatus_cf.AAC.2